LGWRVWRVGVGGGDLGDLDASALDGDDTGVQGEAHASGARQVSRRSLRGISSRRILVGSTCAPRCQGQA